MGSKARILLVEDDELTLSMVSRSLKKAGYDIATACAANGLLEQVEAWSPDVILLDITLPDGSGLDVLERLRKKGVGAEVVMLTADRTAGSAIRAMKLGAADYLTKPYDLEEVKIVLRKILEKKRLERELDYRRKVDSDRPNYPIVGDSPPMGALREKIRRLAEARVSTVLITGESGTGKELVARALHEACFGSSSGFAPFIGVNCTALPESLIESELFGHEKGAFTDAKSEKKGVFELAQGGTVLLDEIGDMPLSLQTKLLRVLEERSLRRIGGKNEIPVNAMVLASTNRDLLAAGTSGRFRMDVYYRLNAFSLQVPALRDRGHDIVDLANYFASHFCARYSKRPIQGFTPECEQMLLRYDWPGNVRELRNVIERIVVLESADWVGPEHLPLEIRSRGSTRSDERPFKLPESGLSLEELKRDLIRQAVERAAGNKTQAARLLGISYEALRYQLTKYGID
ncbi:MAG: sigma-54-dependent Fis family transcriptional regulator [Deltaproteobacteria bacterium]|nr:sigma-54-dependent Fis family transcriptional regulator [Deltaproteobacteria bacterium]